MYWKRLRKKLASPVFAWKMVTELGCFRVCYVQMLLSATAPNKKDWRDSLTNCICLVCPYQYCVPATHSADPSCRKHNWSTSSGHRSSFQHWQLPTMLLSYWLFSGQDLWYSPCPRLRPQAEFFYIYGWLIKICGCFTAKPKNCGERIFLLKILTVYQICG